jgi:hypothetical protein
MTTTITGWNPFNELVEFHNATNRMFDERLRPPFRTGDGEDVDRSPLSMDVMEASDDYVVQAAVPGVAPEDVNIQIEDDALTISGEFSEKETSENGEYIRQELRYGGSIEPCPSTDARRRRRQCAVRERHAETGTAQEAGCPVSHTQDHAETELSNGPLASGYKGCLRRDSCDAPGPLPFRVLSIPGNLYRRKAVSRGIWLRWG